mmetsp:Transcript_23798/g.33314  ORF Transcript_23798/g.33314 Transcript_23798/m.33314 type:complete len:844 (-) Transcript_23798:116-2647(-)|eukprot:CAMPEP_0184486548 /NCGR_PEP_ID=MMETSP0113_2-20130426/8029_1 /TAXON_ID=91329 /ORGANISM="Norrisiella sphaerica, Strain BC52" /LENGTH=843 /DNA_ID=CAMNT_0026868475 /DNA_START=230 /DNA_END=2761 /DNA_ORIENTATION=+
MSDIDGSDLKLDQDKHKVFRKLFELPRSERLQNYYSCAYHKKILLQGRLYLSRNYLCFYSNVFGYETKVIISMADVLTVEKKNTALVIPNAIQVDALQTQYFFASFMSRDQAFDNIQDAVREYQQSLASLPTSIYRGPETKDKLISTSERDADDDFSGEDESLEEEAFPSQRGSIVSPKASKLKGKEQGTAMTHGKNDLDSPPNNLEEKGHIEEVKLKQHESVDMTDKSNGLTDGSMIPNENSTNGEKGIIGDVDSPRGAIDSTKNKKDSDTEGDTGDGTKVVDTQRASADGSSGKKKAELLTLKNGGTSMFTDMHVHALTPREESEANNPPPTRKRELALKSAPGALAGLANSPKKDLDNLTVSQKLGRTTPLSSTETDTSEKKKSTPSNLTRLKNTFSFPLSGSAEKKAVAKSRRRKVRSKTPPDSNTSNIKIDTFSSTFSNLTSQPKVEPAHVPRISTDINAGKHKKVYVPRSVSDDSEFIHKTLCLPEETPVFTKPVPPSLNGRRATTVDFSRAGVARYPFSARSFWDTYMSDSCPLSLAQFHKSCEDEGFRCSKWKEQTKGVWHRTIYFIKTKLSGPLGPKQTRVHKVQRCEVFKGGILIDSNSIMPDVPYGGYFHVAIRWVILDTPNARAQVPKQFLRLCPTKERCRAGLIDPSSGDEKGPTCLAQMWTAVEFTKFTMIKYQIKSFSNTGVRAFVKEWLEFSKKGLQSLPKTVLNALKANQGEVVGKPLEEEDTSDAAAMAQKMMGPDSSAELELELDEGAIEGCSRSPLIGAILGIVGDQGSLKLEEGVSLLLVLVAILILVMLSSRNSGGVSYEDFRILQQKLTALQNKLDNLEK